MAGAEEDAVEKEQIEPVEVGAVVGLLGKGDHVAAPVRLMHQVGLVGELLPGRFPGEAAGQQLFFRFVAGDVAPLVELERGEDVAAINNRKRAAVVTKSQPALRVNR